MHEPMTREKMYALMSKFADSLPEEGGGEYGEGGDMASGDMGGAPPQGEVEISVETKPEGMRGEKMCPHCGKSY